MVIPQKTRGSKRFFWDFTLNNYTNEDCESVKEILEKISDAFVVGKEIGKEKETPHLQGCIKLKKGNYKTYLINQLGERFSFREGRNIEAMRDYCMKDNIWIKKNIERIKIYKNNNERINEYRRINIFEPMFQKWRKNMSEIYPNLINEMTYENWYKNTYLKRNDMNNI